MHARSRQHCKPKRSTRRGLSLRVLSLVLVVLVAVVAVACLGGCKATDVLTEHIEDQELGKLDPTQEPIYKENPKADFDSSRQSTKVKNSDRVDKQKAKIPVYDKNASSNGEAIKRTYSSKSNNDETAAKGTEPSKKKGKSKKTQDKSKTESTQSTSTNKSDKSDSQSQTSGGSGKSSKAGTLSTGSGIGGTGTVYDSTGEDQELPEYCDKVAAAGCYATIVQMLGGQGGLVACDSAWKKAATSKGLFPGEGVSSIDEVWTGNASSGYTLNVTKLIKAEPDAILVDGTTVTLTTKQKRRIQKANIDIITVPELGISGTPDDNIVKAVNTVGELLKNSSKVTYKTQKMAQNYETMHDDTIKACVKSNGGYSTKSVGGTSWNVIYQDSSGKGNGTSTSNLSGNRITTVFVDSWASANTKTVKAKRSYSGATPLYLDEETVDLSDGVGLSATVSSNQFALVDYYFQVSGVVNNAYDYMRPRSSESKTSSPYALIAGVYTKNIELSGDISLSNRSAPSALWYCPSSYSSDSTWLTVGDSSFPGVVTRTSSIAKKIVSSANKTNGLYNVGQSYKVYVMPSGIDGSWSTGTAESYLASVWALKTFAGVSGADDYVNQYYQTFYRVKKSKGTSLVSNYKTSYTAKCPTN